MNAAITWRGFDVTLLQREIISTLTTVERFTRSPRVLDVDDAIYLFRDGGPARRLARLADLVVCGNSTLADWFADHASRVTVLPTAVNTEALLPADRRGGNGSRIVVGWIGTSANLIELQRIESALLCALNTIREAVLTVVSDRPPTFSLLPPDRVEYIKWSQDREIGAIRGMDIGLMPLEDNPWNRGKCGFKMLQYLSCGIPAVVSPVGMNVDVLSKGRAAIGAQTLDEWADAIINLARAEDERAHMGALGRQLVQQHYSVQAIAPSLAECLRSVVEIRN